MFMMMLSISPKIVYRTSSSRLGNQYDYTRLLTMTMLVLAHRHQYLLLTSLHMKKGKERVGVEIFFLSGGGGRGPRNKVPVIRSHSQKIHRF